MTIDWPDEDPYEMEYDEEWCDGGEVGFNYKISSKTGAKYVEADQWITSSNEPFHYWYDIKKSLNWNAERLEEQAHSLGWYLLNLKSFLKEQLEIYLDEIAPILEPNIIGESDDPIITICA